MFLFCHASCDNANCANVTLLQVMKRLEDEQASGHVKSVRIRQLSVPLPVTSDPEGRALLVALFNKADADHNGRLTWQEFQNALHFINDDL